MYNHLSILEIVLKKLIANSLKCKIEILFLGQTVMEYMGFWVTQTGT